MALAAELEKGAQRGDGILLGGDVAVGDGALPQVGFVEKRSKGGGMLVGGSFEQFGGLFVGAFTDLPDLDRETAWSVLFPAQQVGASQRTLCTQRSVRGKELKSSS